MCEVDRDRDGEKESDEKPRKENGRDTETNGGDAKRKAKREENGHDKESTNEDMDRAEKKRQKRTPSTDQPNGTCGFRKDPSTAEQCKLFVCAVKVVICEPDPSSLIQQKCNI